MLSAGTVGVCIVVNLLGGSSTAASIATRGFQQALGANPLRSSLGVVVVPCPFAIMGTWFVFVSASH